MLFSPTDINLVVKRPLYCAVQGTVEYYIDRDRHFTLLEKLVCLDISDNVFNWLVTARPLSVKMGYDYG